MADTRKPLILTLHPVDAAAPAPLELDAASAIETPPAGPAPVPIELLQTPDSPRPAPQPALVARPQAKVKPAPKPKPDRRERDAARQAAAEAKRSRALAAKPPAPLPAQRGEAGPALARWAYPAAAAAALLWAGSLVAFVVGFERREGAFASPMFHWGVIAGLALLPAALMFVFGYLLRQSARLADEARRARTLAQELAVPAALASAHVGGAMGVVREEIARAQAAADEAARRMAALGDSLGEETRRVSEAAGQAERAASRLGGRLQSERAELASLTGTLDAQLVSASEGAARHARLAAEASDLANANLQEAQASLAARTADLVSAAGDALRASQSAGGELARGGERLERLTADLRRGQAEWSAAAQALLSEQEDVSARLETERARYLDAAAEARGGADALAAATAGGAEAMRRLTGEAVRSGQALAEAAREHATETAGRLAAAQAALETEHLAALDRIAASAEEARARAARSASEVAVEAERAGEAARLRVEGLAEAAFAAGQRADQAFDTRLSAAKRAIEAQATLVEDAGLRSAARIEAGVGAVRTALGEAEGLAEEVERRFRQIAQAPRATALAPSAPPPPSAAPAPEPVAPAASPTAAAAPVIEPATAARAVSGFERLNLAMRADHDAPAASRPAAPAGSSPTPSARAVELPPPQRPDDAPAPRTTAPTAAAPAVAPVPEPPSLRPRLKLASVDEELFGAPSTPDLDLRAPSPADDVAPAGADGDAWSWKDLLTAIDDPQPMDDDALAERMIGEIEAMGVDPGALLPRARIDEIARAVDAGDASKARETVRRLAPAAVRRLSRRVLTDKVLRGQADLYRRRYGELVRRQARANGAEDDGGVSALLGSDPGRAFLLLDAAVGDLH